MLRQDETDKPLIAIWIPEAMEWSMLGSNTEEEGGGRLDTAPPPTFSRLQKIETKQLVS